MKQLAVPSVWKAQLHGFLQLLLLLLLSRFSCVRLLATPWAAAHQAPPSMGFSGQEYWSGVPLPSPFHDMGKWNFEKLIISINHEQLTWLG